MKASFFAAALVLAATLSTHAAAELRLVDPATLGFDPVKLGRIEVELRKFVADDRIPGAVVAVMRHDQLAYFKAIGKRRPGVGEAMPVDALFQIFSMTKPIVAVAVMRLMEQGKLSLDDPLAKFIPAFANLKVWQNGAAVAAKQPIRIADLLRHTSGLTYGFFGRGHVRRLYQRRGVGRRSQSLAEFTDTLARLPLEHQPGTVWEYSLSSDVLGRVVEIASGQPLPKFLRGAIFEPLGMKDTSFTGPWVADDRVAYPALQGWQLYNASTEVRFKQGGGGLVSTLADYLRFCRMLANGGAIGGVRILKAATVRLMTRDQLGGRPGGKYYLPGAGYGFGFGFAVRTSASLPTYPGNVGDYWWGGYAGTYFWIDPVAKIVAVLMTQAPSQRRFLRPLLRRLVYGALKR